MRAQRKRHRVLKTIAILLLALLCIGGAELLVCRFAAPALYDRITAPVVQLAQNALDQGKSLAHKISPKEDTPPVSQAISEPEEQEAPPAEDPKVTEFVTRQGQDVLTGGVVELVYFNQGEAPWADSSYGPDPIRGYGCGPTSLAMLISSLTGQLLTPSQAAEEAYQAGYCAPGSGSYLSIVEGMAQAYGLKAEPFRDFTADALCRELASGSLFVALMGKGHFTNGGHFIVLRGVTLDGRILVADPNSRERSLASWDPQLILDELSASRSNGAPLWRFSTLQVPAK